MAIIKYVYLATNSHCETFGFQDKFIKKLLIYFSTKEFEQSIDVGSADNR